MYRIVGSVMETHRRPDRQKSSHILSSVIIRSNTEKNSQSHSRGWRFRSGHFTVTNLNLNLNRQRRAGLSPQCPNSCSHSERQTYKRAAWSCSDGHDDLCALLADVLKGWSISAVASRCSETRELAGQRAHRGAVKSAQQELPRVLIVKGVVNHIEADLWWRFICASLHLPQTRRKGGFIVTQPRRARQAGVLSSNVWMQKMRQASFSTKMQKKFY